MLSENTAVDAAVPAPDLTGRRGGVSLLQRFAREEKGNVAMIFGLTTIIVVSMVGGAVDYGRWLSARNQTQAAVDSALLAAGRTSQTTYGDATASVKAASAYYNQMKSNIVVDDTIQFEAINAATTFTAKGSAYIQTPFLSIVGIDRLPVLKISDATQAEATIAQGGNSGSSVEIGLMLDTTGSMLGQKIVDLKAAANDLVDIVVWNDQSSYSSRVGIAPFASTVNVGDYFQAVTNQNPNLVTHTVTTQTGTTYTYSYPQSCYKSNGRIKDSCSGEPQYIYRIGAGLYDDHDRRQPGEGQVRRRADRHVRKFGNRPWFRCLDQLVLRRHEGPGRQQSQHNVPGSLGDRAVDQRQDQAQGDDRRPRCRQLDRRRGRYRLGLVPDLAGMGQHLHRRVEAG